MNAISLRFILPCVVAIAGLSAALAGVAAKAQRPVIPLRFDCSREEAVSFDVAEFARAPERYVGRCVQGRGLVASRKLFADVPDFYRPARLDRRIASYGGEAAGDDLWGIRQVGDFVAFAYTCEDLSRWNDAEIERGNAENRARGDSRQSIPFITGECHYHDGPALFVSRWSPVESAATRLKGPAAARIYGDLVDMPPEWRYARVVQRNVRTRVDLSRAQDREGMTNAINALYGASADEPAGEPDEFVRDFAEHTLMRLAFLRGAPPPAVKYFLHKVASRGLDGDYTAYGCVCKTASCTGQWPISSLDTDHEAQWPYACIRVERVRGELRVE